MVAAEVCWRHLSIVLHREVAAEEAAPLARKAAQAVVRPCADGGVPGRAGAADAEEGAGEGMVDGALEARALAAEGNGALLAEADPAAPALRDDQRAGRPMARERDLLTRHGEAC